MHVRKLKVGIPMNRDKGCYKLSHVWPFAATGAYAAGQPPRPSLLTHTTVGQRGTLGGGTSLFSIWCLLHITSHSVYIKLHSFSDEDSQGAVERLRSKLKLLSVNKELSYLDQLDV